MKYFETIKAALDASISGICTHMGLTQAQAYEAAKRHLEAMSNEWYSGDTPNIAYKDPLCRFAYLYAHTGANANLCEVAIKQSKVVRDRIAACLDKRGELRVCAFGGGPGTELLAIAKYIIGTDRSGPPASIDFTLLDRVTEWCETWNALEAEIKDTLRKKHKHASQWPFTISKTFVGFDMLDMNHYANLANVFTHDLYILNYVVSEVLADAAAFQKMIDKMSHSAKKSAVFLVVDRDQDKICDHAHQYLKKAGLVVGDCIKSSRNMDSDEDSSDLEPYPAKIGRKPRVQWGKRGGRGSFWLVGEKP